MRLASSGSVKPSIARRKLGGSYRLSISCQKGFGGSKKSKSGGGGFNQLKKGETLDPRQGWAPLATTADFSTTKETCPVITRDGIALVLYRVKGKYYCSDANSTAFKFPMNDAKIIDGPNGPVAECPLDGTTYDLQTGEVLEWCPKTNPIRALLGTLKSSEEPKPLSVYNVVLADDGMLYAKLF